MRRVLCGRTIVAWAFAAWALAAAVAPGEGHAASGRIALVIGNGDYTSIGELRNPKADGELIAKTLESLDFETTLLLNGTQIDMKRAIAAFGRELRTRGKETVGLFYYAGHGIQAGGRNYLMPVEANPQDEADLDLVGVQADWVLRQMESAGNQSNIVILDACRNNPLGANSRSASRGLARIEAPTGSFIAYATAPGSTAVDGDGANSPFSAALAAALTDPARPIEQIFKDVRKTVITATNGRQTPWDSSSLVQDFYFADPKPVQVSNVTRSAANGEPSPVELSLWQSVSKSGDAGRIALFLQLFPESGFAPEARTLMMQVLAGDSLGRREPEAAAAPAPPAVVAPAAVQPSEHELIAKAQTSGALSDYAAYLAAYPRGVFADLAKAEIEHLVASSASAPQTPAAPAPAAAAPEAAPQGERFAMLTFDRPIPHSEAGWAAGRSLREMARASPEYPPLEGLDPAIWKNQKCSNCHNWSMDNLCDQGKFYVKAGDDALKRKLHPYGGDFKSALAAWAKAGCK